MEVNKTQFKYKREISHPGITENTEKGIVGVEPYKEIVYDSFDIDRIVRTIHMDDGKRLVLLDDLHERYDIKPKTHPKTGAPIFDKKGQMMFERVKDTFQSEIYLSKEEGEQLLTLISINLI